MGQIGYSNHIYIRRDFEYNWEKFNPILREDELICVIKNHCNNYTNAYKMGDGKHKYTELEFLDEIPKFFKINGFYIHLDGIQCLLYNKEKNK